MQNMMSINRVEYAVIKLLGHGKGGYSYLVEKDGKLYVGVARSGKSNLVWAALSFPGTAALYSVWWGTSAGGPVGDTYFPKKARKVEIKRAKNGIVMVERRWKV